MKGAPVLDVACGPRMFYFQPDSPDVEYCDLNPHRAVLCDGRALAVDPDTVADFRDLPFADASRDLVVFDPPHLDVAGPASWQAAKYGKLPADWRDALARGFSECWRVLRPGGTLVFKWYEYRIKLADLRPLFPAEPLLGNRRPHASKTHWLLFYKPRREAGIDEREESQ